jgi:hypothetical protein
MRGVPVIRPDVVNFLIVWAFMIIARFIGNFLAALFHDSAIGQGLSLVCA